MPAQIARSPLGHLVQKTAKTHAIAGAAAGVAVGVIGGIISVRRSQVRDRYDVAAEGLTHIGTGRDSRCIGRDGHSLGRRLRRRDRRAGHPGDRGAYGREHRGHRQRAQARRSFGPLLE